MGEGCRLEDIYLSLSLSLSLGDGEEYANTERFQGSPSLLPCVPAECPKGGGVCGVYLESP